MEGLFCNKFVRDEDTAKEVYVYWYFKKPLLIVVYSLIALYSLACILGFILDFESAKEALGVFVMGVFVFVLMIVSYHSQVKAMVQRDKEMSGGKPLCCEISVSENEITLSALESRSSVAMSNIKSAFETENYIVVLTKARLMFIFKKDSFTKGDAKSFIAFLKEKGIKVKGKNN